MVRTGSIRDTCVKVIKRPPHGAVRDVGEERRHVATVEAPKTVCRENLHRDVSGLAESHPVLGRGDGHLGLELKAREVFALALHHELLGDHVDGHGDALGHQRGGATSHQRLDGVAGGILRDVLPDQLVRGDVGLTGDQREGVDHEAAVQAPHAFGSQDLAEGVERAVVKRLPLLDLQPGPDQGEGVDGGARGQGHEHAQRVELPLVQVFPFYDPDVPLLLHGSGWRQPSCDRPCAAPAHPPTEPPDTGTGQSQES